MSDQAEKVPVVTAAMLADDDVFGDLSGLISEAVIGVAAAMHNGRAVHIERCYSVGVARAVIAALRNIPPAINGSS